MLLLLPSDLIGPILLFSPRHLGRIRRLLAMADRRAMEQGIPNTEASLTVDMLP